MKRIIFALLIIFLFAACSLAPKYERPGLKLPDTEIKDNSTNVTIKWWENFNDKTLNILIEQALKSNDNLLIAYERINEMEAAFNFAKSELYPVVNGKGSATRIKTSDESSYYGKGITENYFNLSGSVSYEVDVFGKLKNKKKAQLALLLAQKSYAQTVKIKLISDVAGTYFEIAATNEQIRIMEKLIKRYQESYRYRQKQYKHGIVDSLTVTQEKAKFDSSKLNLEKLKQNKKIFENFLALLLGKEPAEIFNSGNIFNVKLPNPINIPSFVPSQIIEKRPDIIEAEERLKAADFEIGVAKAAYFPTISLTGVLGLESNDLSDLIRSSAKFWNIGGTALSPIFSFGRIKAKIKIATSKQKQALFNYVYTVKNAFKEIHEAFIKLDSIKKQINIQKKRIEDYKKILDISKKQYKNGLIDYINIIDAKRNYENSYLNLMSLKKEYLEQEVFLYKAIGM